MSWDAVETTLPAAHGMAWDGSNDIFIILDEDDVQRFRANGYEVQPCQLIAFEQPVAVDAARSILGAWYDAAGDDASIRTIRSGDMDLYEYEVLVSREIGE